MALNIDELNIQITSNSTNATRALTSLIKKLERLKASLDGTSVSNITITNSFNKTTNSVKKADTAVAKYNTTSKTAGKSTVSFTDKLAMNISKWRTLFGVFQSAANVMASWFEESNDYIETMNLFNVTMGRASEEANAYAQKVSDAMGIDIAEWMQNQGTFKQLASGFGVASDTANIMSQNLTQLSYDMASFFNTDVETAFDKLSSAMAGQVKGLRDFGIDVTVASLQEYALAKGIEKSVRSMTQAEKALLRYNYIMEKSINIQGDMARTIITPANALRILQAQLVQLKRAFGNIISVLAVKLIPYVQAFVEIITEAAQRLAEFFGFDAKDYAADLSGLEELGVFDEEAESAEDLSGTLKKIKKQLMGFDELNIINNPDSDSGSGTDAGLGSLNIDPLEYDFLSGLNVNTEEIKEKLKTALAGLAGVLGGFEFALGTLLVVTGANIPLGLSLMVFGAASLISAIAVNWGSMNSTMATTLSTVTGVLGGFLLALGAVLAFSGASMPLGIALMVGGAASLVTALAIDWTSTESPILGTLTTLEGLVGGASLALGAMLAFSGANVPLGIAFMLIGATAIMSAVSLNWDEMSDKVKGVLGDISTAVGGAMLALGALLAFTGVSIPLGIAFMLAGAVSIATGATLNWNATSDKVSAVVKTITGVVGGAMLALGAILAFGGVNIPLGITLMALGAVSLASTIAMNWNSVSDQTKKTITTIAAIAGGALLALGVLLLFSGAGIPLGLGLIVAGAASLGTSIAPNWNSIVKTVSAVFTTIGEVATAAFKGIGNFFIGILNGLISGLNWCIDAINLIPGVELDKIGHIQYLAEGGIVDEGQMFIAREAGPELVGSIGRKTAVANNDQIIEGIYRGVYSAMMAANNGKGGNITVNATIEMDGEVVGRKAIQYHNGVVMQTGESPLLV